MSTISPTPARSRSRRIWFGVGTTVLLGALVAACSGRALHGHGWHRHGHGLHDVSSPEEARERAHSGVEWVLDELDATEDQVVRIRAIVDESVEQLHPLHERHRRNQADLIDAIGQPRIDRARLEQLRKAEIEIADVASNWLLDAAVDAFEVLTPEQRTQVMKHVRERHS